MGNDKFKSALWGAIAGLITGILIAPKSGKETRQDVKETLGKLKNDISEKLSGLSEVTKDSYDDVINEVVDAYEREKSFPRKTQKR